MAETPGTPNIEDFYRDLLESVRFYIWRVSLDIPGTRAGDYLKAIAALLETVQGEFSRCKMYGPTKTGFRRVRDAEKTYALKYSDLMESANYPEWPLLAPLVDAVLKYFVFRVGEMVKNEEEPECPRSSAVGSVNGYVRDPTMRPLPGSYCASGAIAPTCESKPAASGGTSRKPRK